MTQLLRGCVPQLSIKGCYNYHAVSAGLDFKVHVLEYPHSNTKETVKRSFPFPFPDWSPSMWEHLPWENRKHQLLHLHLTTSNGTRYCSPDGYFTDHTDRTDSDADSYVSSSYGPTPPDSSDSDYSDDVDLPLSLYGFSAC